MTDFAALAIWKERYKPAQINSSKLNTNEKSNRHRKI